MLYTIFVDKRSFVHRLDPRTKLLAFVAFSVLLFAFDNAIFLSLFLVAEAIVVFAARIAARIYQMRNFLVTFAIFTFIVWQFSANDSPIVMNIGPFALKEAGIRMGGIASMRVISMILIGTILMATTPIEEISLAAVHFGIPYAAAFAFTLTARLIPSFAAAADDVVRAQRARGVDLRKRNWIRRTGQIVNLTFPLMSHAFRQVLVLAMALETRGWRVANERTSFIELKFALRDYVTLCVQTVVVACAAFLKLAGCGILCSY
jgi:energy-coupling factor transport system permease protein